MMTPGFFAYAFKSDLSLAQMFARLNDVGPWQWVEWYNDRWGDYIWARTSADYPEPQRARVKICEEEGQYALVVKFESTLQDRDDEIARLRGTLIERVLPAIGAREVAEMSPDFYD